MILNRESYLKRSIVREVPLADGAVICIRALPASAIVNGAEDPVKTFTSENLLVQSLCDSEGNLLFADGEQGEAMRIDHASLRIIMDAILDLNGLRPAKGGKEEGPEKN